MLFHADSLQKVAQRAANDGLFSKVEASLLTCVLIMTHSLMLHGQVNYEVDHK